jgi:hypothetical protein
MLSPKFLKPKSFRKERRWRNSIKDEGIVIRTDGKEIMVNRKSRKNMDPLSGGNTSI